LLAVEVVGGCISAVIEKSKVITPRRSPHNARQ
jgi:hypothetical protein